ncbi:NAD(+) diphosphatase [Zooshikella harenae]|uniref:NAD(+) diphosphatase n=1 Tax=Zooshikella harenae TaxID=2827238 RepID=A0ABS5ZEB7_9GAMM|nr:NAD(+) diphosphatase [Zooshikella harenae]MBU2711615.1 NAD(+) diphosphatase [Zooshikella harenae]
MKVLLDPLPFTPYVSSNLSAYTKHVVFIDGQIVCCTVTQSPLLTASQWQALQSTLTCQALSFSLALFQQQHVAGHVLPADAVLPKSFELMPLRTVLLSLAADAAGLLNYAMQLADWHDLHRYCGRCSQPLVDHPTERAKVCRCGARSRYPTISPCVIVLITRGEQMLLARAPHHPEGWYSTIAGFLEPGESVEQGLKREVKEEVGVEVCNLEYKASQPWPFPNSLMLGFRADHKAGEIEIDNHEIVAADWFSPNNLPQLPPPISIARWLIDDFLSSG